MEQDDKIYVIEEVDGWYLISKETQNEEGNTIYILGYVQKEFLENHAVETFETIEDLISSVINSIDRAIASAYSIGSQVGLNNNFVAMTKYRTRNSDKFIVQSFNDILSELNTTRDFINSLRAEAKDVIIDINQTNDILSLLDKANTQIDSIESMTIEYRDDNVTEIKTASDNIVSSLKTLRRIFINDDNTSENNNTYEEQISKLVYRLNTLEVNDANVIVKIETAINTLETIKPALDELTTYDGDRLKQEYDGIKKMLDDAKKSIDDIKQAIDNNIADNDKKDALKKEADSIKKALDDIKKLIDGYKKDEDNSPEAINAIKAEIDKVIAMMRSGEVITAIENKIAVPKGRSLISGNIAIDNLSDAIYAIWMVDNAKWYGYSPHADVREQIKAKYRLIEGTIPPHKAVLVWATEDTSIDVGDNTPIEATHIYGSNFSMHGADNRGLSITGVECSQDNYSMTIAVKLMGDVPSVYMAERVHEELESFSTIYQNDGYFVLCEKE